MRHTRAVIHKDDPAPHHQCAILNQNFMKSNLISSPLDCRVLKPHYSDWRVYFSDDYIFVPKADLTIGWYVRHTNDHPHTSVKQGKNPNMYHVEKIILYQPNSDTLCFQNRF